jgi:hypothetical protein
LGFLFLCARAAKEPEASLLRRPQNSDGQLVGDIRIAVDAPSVGSGSGNGGQFRNNDELAVVASANFDFQVLDEAWRLPALIFTMTWCPLRVHILALRLPLTDIQLIRQLAWIGKKHLSWGLILQVGKREASTRHSMIEWKT